jgi:hypothetical protein
MGKLWTSGKEEGPFSQVERFRDKVVGCEEHVEVEFLKSEIPISGIKKKKDTADKISKINAIM